MNKKNRMAIFSIAALFALACACPATSLPISGNEPQPQPSEQKFIYSTGPAPTSEPIPQNIPAGEVIFTDDFSVTSAEMEEYADENGTVGTENGVYVLRSTGDLWHWGRSTSEFSDVIIEVDLKMSAGPANDNAGYGVVCRLSTREDTSIDGYMFAITADGYYTIRSITSSSMSPLVDYTFSEIINQGTGTNRIRATCDGSNLTFEVNGQILATASTTVDGSNFGSIAFSGISYEDTEPIVEVHFDNLVVSKP
jgi:hypothetical protein